MAEQDALGREIDFGVEDGGPKGNWRKPGPDEQNISGRSTISGNLADTQGAYKKNGWEGVRDVNIGPPIHKGERPDFPTIAEVVRKRRQSRENEQNGQSEQNS